MDNASLRAKKESRSTTLGRHRAGIVSRQGRRREVHDEGHVAHSLALRRLCVPDSQQLHFVLPLGYG